MAIAQTTTTSGLTSLAGTQGEIYLNTDTDRLIFFHQTGVGNYKTFSADGSSNASIQFTFGGNGYTGVAFNDLNQYNSYEASFSDLTGYYKRYDVLSESTTAVLADANMSGSLSSLLFSKPSYGMGSAPYLYQATGANSPYAHENNFQGVGNEPSFFVYTGSTREGAVQSRNATYTDMSGNPATHPYVPYAYVINDPNSNSEPYWALSVALDSGNGTIEDPYEETASGNSFGEAGLLFWGGYTTVSRGTEDWIQYQPAGSSATDYYGNTGVANVTQIYHP